MPNYIFYNPADPIVPGAAVRYREGMSQADAEQADLPYVEVGALPAPLSHIKVAGGVPVTMTQIEIDAIAADGAARSLAKRRVSLTDAIDGEAQVILLKSLVTLMVQQFNTLRALHGLAALDAAAVRAALRNQIQSEIEATQ